MEGITINSNINLYYMPMTKLKTTTLGVYIHRNLNEKDVSKNAVLPHVMKRGCKLCPDSESIAEYLENLYGAHIGVHTLKFGDDQVIYFGFETVSDKYAPEGEKLVSAAAKLMMSVVFEPEAFTDEIIEQEKKNAKDRIMAEMNDKAVYAMHRCGEEMCKGDSFALSAMGTTEGVEEITAGNLREYYDSIITSSVIDIYICGECNINKTTEEIKQYTASFGFKKASLPQSKIVNSQEEVKKVTDRMDVVQGKLCMGFRTGIKPEDSDYIPLMVMNSIYGGGAHSKLFNNVREKLSLCYYASSSIVKNKGIVFVNAGIEFENFEKAYDEILAQLEAVKDGEISELEFNSSISALVNQFESAKDSQHQLQIYYLGQKISGTDYDIDTFKDKISRVTIEDVKRAAKNVELDTVYFLTGKGEA